MSFAASMRILVEQLERTAHSSSSAVTATRFPGGIRRNMGCISLPVGFPTAQTAHLMLSQSRWTW